ncbi:DUF6233 domain-containing protein [Streptomyces ziwulingensis]|uniref:DUF6233 domain-containing protein n=1 Tax=Streptomyces ziwulingensis TaxID=1045501 RepID=A0ABP9AKZ4_9ACTN
MIDLPSDLPRLRVLETWHALWLDRVRRKIAEVEIREAGRQRAPAARPPAPDWLLERGLNGEPAHVHHGDCWKTRGSGRIRGIDRDQALRALADGVAACGTCRPDAELGYLEG